jgi:hypothetical protein
MTFPCSGKISFDSGRCDKLSATNAGAPTFVISTTPTLDSKVLAIDVPLTYLQTRPNAKETQQLLATIPPRPILTPQ